MIREQVNKLAPLLFKCLSKGDGEKRIWLCTNGYQDISVILVLVVVIFVVRTLIQVKILPILSHDIKVGIPAKIKLHDETWFFLAHMLTFAFGIYAILDEPYATAIIGNRDAMRAFWTSYPAQHIYIKPVTHLFYLISGSFWIHNFFDLLLERLFGPRYMRVFSKLIGFPINEKYLELMPDRHRRTEFVPMLCHHIATAILISSSYLNYFTRIGHTILVITDVSDIFLNLAKIFFRSGKKNSSNIIFAIFATSWFFTRIYVFFNVVISYTLGSIDELVHNCYSWDSGSLCIGSIAIYVLNGCFLLCLQLLFTYWSILILKTIYFSVTSDARDVTDDNSSSCSESFSEKLQTLDIPPTVQSHSPDQTPSSPTITNRCFE